MSLNYSNDTMFNMVNLGMETGGDFLSGLASKSQKYFHMNNRRYLGKKYKLISFIKHVVENECQNVETIIDIFAGTGVVANAFLDKKIITNDILYSNYISHYAWFSHEHFNEQKLLNLINYYNSVSATEDNYMSENFAGTFFTLQVTRNIGFIRQNIEDLYRSGTINQRERAILITSLLYAMDKIANTCGHYDAYRRNTSNDSPLELLMLKTAAVNPNNELYNTDANQLAKQLHGDLVYIDPPYNSRQYCDAYHLLENVARWQKPPVTGMARKMDRTNLKSDYCTTKAKQAFADLINNISAKYILVSYNNMGNKGDGRSNAKITDTEILAILRKKGPVKTFSEDYKAFTAGKSIIANHQERLFLCTCIDFRSEKKEILPSPFNYSGGKYKLLPQILPLFPPHISKFIDLFCGGANVGINTNCENVIFYDNNTHLINLYNTLQKLDKAYIFDTIDKLIANYQLTRSSELGYAYYHSNSPKGLAAVNKPGFEKLRIDFNNYSYQDDFYYLMLYVLIIYSFNNQIRFNREGKFNLPVGKRDLNNKMRLKLSKFIDRLHQSQYSFVQQDFRLLAVDSLPADTFIYADPPYLITCASYNEQNSWSQSLEYDLLNLLDKVHRQGLKFALSNVIKNKGKENEVLKAWLTTNRSSYRIHYLQYNYANSNYHTKDRQPDSTTEVLITNY